MKDIEVKNFNDFVVINMNDADENVDENEVDENVVVCENCGKVINRDDAYYCADDDKYYCEECAFDDDILSYCEHCGSYHFTDNFTRIYNKRNESEWWCDECRDQYAERCNCCGDWFAYNAITYIEDIDARWCDSCLDNGAYYCHCCGNYYTADSFNFGEDCCINCAIVSKIRQYHNAPNTQLFGDAKKMWRNRWRGLGVELEIDTDEDNRDKNEISLVEKLENIAGEHVYFEHDGSLNYGFEIITQPHTIDEFYRIKWAEILKACVDYGYKSHDAGTCGLHVHVSRNMFGSTKAKQNLTVAKVISFYEIFWRDILKLSRRTESQADNWASRYCCNGRRDALEFAKGDYGRYHAVNVTNRATIEFRICRGTLNYKSFMAWIDFTLTVVKNARMMKWSDVYDAKKWLKGLKAETLEYIKNRNAFEGVR